MKTASAAQINPVVAVHNGKLVTDSLNIAEVFGKDHHNVLKAIQTLDVPKEFGDVNFNATEYTTAQGKKLPRCEMTRDGFTLLAMGFTGPKAMKFKLAYIEAFSKMEEELTRRTAAPEITAAPASPGQKRCSRCGEVKALSEFGIRLAYRDGHNHHCFPCYKDDQRRYRDRNRERNLAATIVGGASPLAFMTAKEAVLFLMGIVRTTVKLSEDLAGLSAQCLRSGASGSMIETTGKAAEDSRKLKGKILDLLEMALSGGGEIDELPPLLGG